MSQVFNAIFFTCLLIISDLNHMKQRKLSNNYRSTLAKEGMCHDCLIWYHTFVMGLQGYTPMEEILDIRGIVKRI